MNVDVQFSIKLKSGATVETTAAQDAKIRQAIVEIVFYADSEPKVRRSSRSHTFKRWTEEEDARVLEFVNQYPPHAAGRNQAMKRLAGELGRTRQSVLSRADGFRKAIREKRESEARLPENNDELL